MPASFLYFAYGSNMLSARLRERCPSARPVGIADAFGWAVRFHKHGRDGSGKASLAAADTPEAKVPGVLYEIALYERGDLDRAEGRYLRDDAFAVVLASTGVAATASTYIAEAETCRPGLQPFDWYVGLMLAGAREHGLDPGYIGMLAAVEAVADPDVERATLMINLATLGRGGV